MTHSIKAQLRFNDIDILGHLNNTVYFSLYDLGKAKYMESIGLRDEDMARPDCVIVDIHCSYFIPVKYGDDIDIVTHCSHIGEKSFTLHQQMVDGEGRVRSECSSVMVYIDRASGLSAPLPEAYRRKIEDFEHL